MCLSDEKSTCESKSTKFPFEGKCLLPKLDPCSSKTIRPAPVDICHNKYIPTSSPNKRVQPASTVATAASITEPPSPSSTIPSDTRKTLSNSIHLDPPMIIPCTFKDSSPPSQLDHPPNETSSSTNKKVTSDSRLLCPEPKPVALLVKQSCMEPKPVCKDNVVLVKQSSAESKPVSKNTGNLGKKSCSQPPRPSCKDTATIIKPPPKRNPFKTMAFAAAALVGGYVLYETVLKDYIMGVPECDCGCNKKK